MFQRTKKVKVKKNVPSKSVRIKIFCGTKNYWYIEEKFTLVEAKKIRDRLLKENKTKDTHYEEEDEIMTFVKGSIKVIYLSETRSEN